MFRKREQELFTVALCGVQFGVTVRALNLARVKMTSVMGRADRENEPRDLWWFRSAFKNLMAAAASYYLS